MYDVYVYARNDKLLFAGGYKYPIRAVQGATADSVATRKKDENEVPQDWKIKMLYDGDCPLCMHEVC